MKNTGKTFEIKSAPLYHVLGTTRKQVELHIRVIPLTRAVEKGESWFYPSEGGTKKVTTTSLNKIDVVAKKLYRGYCTELGIEKIVELIKATHESILNPKPVSKFAARHQEDIDAVNDVLAGKKNSFTVLYKRYYGIINYKYSSSLKYNKDEADDLTQELFTKVFQNLAKYKPDFTFNSWITCIANNFLIDYTRKKRLETISIDAGFANEKMKNEYAESGTFDIFDDSTLNPEEHLITAQRNVLVNNAISALSPKCRIIMKKRFIEEKSYTEISEEMNLPLGTVKASIFRGKADLEKLVKANKNVLESVLA